MVIISEKLEYFIKESDYPDWINVLKALGNGAIPLQHILSKHRIQFSEIKSNIEEALEYNILELLESDDSTQ